MSGPAILNSIKVLTQTGECEIELCLGDITKLLTKDKVDVVFVSAFHGDYSPVPNSLIRSLLWNLQIDVKILAQDKEEDLRKLYSCWWSKPLPENFPYKRVLCFETKTTSQTPAQEMIGDAFRCLVPILKNEDGSVISPLLNTGSQGYDKDVILTGMVEAAVRWMKAGLPLRLFKIVLYTQGDPSKPDKRVPYGSTLQTFDELKEKYDMQYMLPKQVKIEYDFYISYSESDASIVNEIMDKLKSKKEDVRIFHKRQILDKLSYWQEEMYDVMMKSSRVITVLTPDYMRSTACLEQYNIALCCNRTASRDMLAPFYVVTIENMPTYMGLVQYIDCRSNHEESLKEACSQIIVSLSLKFTRTMSIMDSSIVKYDIFLSYCHKESELAQKMVKMLQGLNPDLKIFFDVQELKTGKSWQRALYHSIDGSECLVALITDNYIKSAVCQEEFNLAMMKHYATMHRLKLIPFVTEELKYLPKGFERVPHVTTDFNHFDEDAAKLCFSVVDWLGDSSLQTEEFPKDVDDPIEVTETWESLRKTQFNETFPDISADFPPELTQTFTKGKKSPKNDCDIVISFDKEDTKYAEWMLALLKHFAPKLNILFARGETDHERLTIVEGAKKFVPLLSPHYVESPERVEEIHIAIWRARTRQNLMVPVHLHSLPPRPAYFHLLRCPVSLNDHLWTDLAVTKKVTLPRDVKKVVGDLGKIPEELAMYTAAFHLLREIEQERERSENIQSWTTPRPALLNIFHLEVNNPVGDDDQPQAKGGGVSQEEREGKDQSMEGTTADGSKKCEVM